MIRQASYADKAALRDIWGAAFHEDTSYTAFIIDHCLKLGTVYWHPRGLACLTLFPVLLFCGERGKYMEGRYVYGVATHPSTQRKGYSSLLLEHVSDLFPFLLLFPASDALSAFYKARGFGQTVNVPEPILSVQKSTPPEDIVFPGVADPDRYKFYLESAAVFGNAFVWPEEMFSFACEECLFRDGSIGPDRLSYPHQTGREEKLFISSPGTLNKNCNKGLVRFSEKKDARKYIPDASFFALPLD